MAKKFKPPPIAKLASVDQAACKYSKELSEVVGVVSLRGHGGWYGNGCFIHCFEFAAWRRTGQPIINKPLTILRPVDADSDYFTEFPECSIHIVSVLLSLDEDRAILAKWIKKDVTDAKLKAIITEQKRPMLLKTNLFGAVKLDRKLNTFVGSTIWDGEQVNITFETDVDGDVSSQIKTAESLFANKEHWANKIRNFAVKSLLKLANEWNDERTQRIAAVEFLSRMCLQSISINRNGHFEFWHSDGELFFGHSIVVSGTVSDGLTECQISG